MSGMAATAAVAAQPFGPGIRVVEQVPYCGDCDNLIGPNFFRNSQIRYIGYLPWTRGCALGGCYGNFAGYGGCYWRETRVAGRLRWLGRREDLQLNDREASTSDVDARR